MLNFFDYIEFPNYDNRQKCRESYFNPINLSFQHQDMFPTSWLGVICTLEEEPFLSLEEHYKLLDDLIAELSINLYFYYFYNLKSIEIKEIEFYNKLKIIYARQLSINICNYVDYIFRIVNDVANLNLNDKFLKVDKLVSSLKNSEDENLIKLSGVLQNIKHELKNIYDIRNSVHSYNNLENKYFNEKILNGDACGFIICNLDKIYFNIKKALANLGDCKINIEKELNMYYEKMFKHFCKKYNLKIEGNSYKFNNN